VSLPPRLDTRHRRVTRALLRPTAALVALAVLFTLTSSASDVPAPPDSPLKKLAGQLAKKRPAPATTQPPSKEALLLPEFRFKPAKTWLLLPDLAQSLGTNEEERAAVLQLLETGATEVRRLLAAEGAENDVAAVTALFMSQLWQIVRGVELPEADVDALHAQIVSVMAGPEVAKMKDADKQRYWEFCVGYPIFIVGMAEVIEGEEQLADLRKAAALGFESLIGVSPELVDIGASGLTLRAGVEQAAAELASEREAQSPAIRETPPTSGPAISGITYTAPAGWSREASGRNVIFRATLGDVDNNGQLERDNDASHIATIALLPILTSGGAGPTALFDQTWRDQFAEYVLGDTFVHYRARMKSNLVVHYMGRFFERPNAPRYEGNPKTYGVLYLVDLGADRFQPIIALVDARDPGVGMDQFKEGAALKALSFPLGAFLDSIKPAKGAPPYPAGGFFSAADIRGQWTQSSSAYGGTYVSATTGAFAGAAVSAAGGRFALRSDGTYEYDFSYYSTSPLTGNSSGSTKHSGRYRLDGDIVLVEPSKPIGYNFTCCAVGVGSRQTAGGVKRILVTVSANSSGGFVAAPLIPNWDSYQGTMTWYTEE
jgi:hypothetical protein